MLKAQKGSDLYDSYGEGSKLKPGTVAVLQNVEGSKLSGRTLLIHEPHSKIFRVPWPPGFKPTGALYGDPPLTVPCPLNRSNKLVIVDQKNGVTRYDDYKTNKGIICFKIDTGNEWMLTGAITLVLSGKLPPLNSSGVPLARMVALQKPSSDPTRTHVDHANRDPTNDRHENIHWVTAQFNTFNVDKETPDSGFHGVVERSQGASWRIVA